MNKNPFLLTFELDPEKQTIEIHADKKGLEKLKKDIEMLISSPGNDHVHLMTPTWGGNELTAEARSETDVVIDHVKIFKWESSEPGF